MNAPLRLVSEPSLSTVTRCTDCAHYVTDTGKCGRASREPNYITGEPQFYSAINERSFDVPGGCGSRAVHFVPTAEAEAARSVRRIQRQQEIEQAIFAHHPDAIDAQQILDALTAALKSRYEDAAADAMESAAEFRLSIEALEGA